MVLRIVITSATVNEPGTNMSAPENGVDFSTARHRWRRAWTRDRDAGRRAAKTRGGDDVHAFRKRRCKAAVEGVARARRLHHGTRVDRGNVFVDTVRAHERAVRAQRHD